METLILLTISWEAKTECSPEEVPPLVFSSMATRSEGSERRGLNISGRMTDLASGSRSVARPPKRQPTRVMMRER